MKHKWMMCVLAVGLSFAGCGKSTNTADQSAPGAPGANSNATNSGTSPQGGTGQPGQMDNNGSVQAQQPAPAPVPPPEPPKPLVVASGRTIPVILTTAVSSYSNKEGDPFEGSVASSVMVNGEVAIPKGSRVRGVVIDAKKQGKFKGEAALGIQLTRITVRGTPYDVSTTPYVATEKGKGKRTAVVTGGGAALGALIGGLAGGGKGAAIGAGVGAGGGLAASGGTGGKNVNLPSETRVDFALKAPIEIERTATEQQ